MLAVSQPVAVHPLAAPAIVDAFARAERAVLNAEAAAAALAAKNARPPAAAPAPEEPPTKPYRIEERVAVVPLSGTILARRTACMKKFPAMFDVAACDEFSAAVLAASLDPDADMIALDVDSPGGQVRGVPEAAGAVLAARERKPVCAFTAGACCSAAYWIASQANAVFASPSASVGSIGVFMAFLDTSRKMENEGLRVELFSTGKYKGAGVTGSLTEAQREHFQAEVLEIFDEFRAAVAPRGIPEEAMQGQTFSGRRAAAARLIDGFALTPLQAARTLAALTATDN